MLRDLEMWILSFKAVPIAGICLLMTTLSKKKKKKDAISYDSANATA